METRDIDQLITELRDLKIRVAQLEAAATDREYECSASTAAAPAAANDCESERSASTAAAPVFKCGDRVKIKNKLKKPATWPSNITWNQDAAQVATVTHNYREQVHFRTDNGVKTWRAQNNLVKLAK
jgi:hypothetical protein